MKLTLDPQGIAPVGDSTLRAEAVSTEALIEAAWDARQRHFGRRVGLFTPLYLSNDCLNNCLYCGFRRDNADAARKTLTVEEALEEAWAIEAEGVRHLLLVVSEHPERASVDYLCDVAGAIRAQTGLTTLGLNAPPYAVEEFRRLREAGYDYYQCFQETYHPGTYREVHPSGPKRRYAWRVEAMDRAAQAGFRRLGMGVLLGLHDWTAEVQALLRHARNLLDRHGVSLSFSVPRLRPAPGAPLRQAPSPVSDDDLTRIVALYRLAFPTAHVVVSTRERPALREDLLRAGASMLSVGSKTWPGGHAHPDRWTAQFDVVDDRAASEVREDLVKKGWEVDGGR